jgi:hypothetical protein
MYSAVKGSAMASRPLIAKVPGLLLSAAMLTSVPAFWFLETTILSGGEGGSHVRHGATLYLNVIGDSPLS